MGDFKYECNDLPVCPHCDYEWNDTCELFEYTPSEVVTVHCPNCTERVVIIENKRISYSTRKADTNG